MGACGVVKHDMPKPQVSSSDHSGTDGSIFCGEAKAGPAMSPNQEVEMDIIQNIVGDLRRIKSVWDVSGQVGASVGLSLAREPIVTDIRPYYENGQMASVTWFAVFAGDEIIARLNAAHMAEIRYFPAESEIAS